nr:MAG TPA: hypothetical protein [Caudoviricetes sp.]
MKNYSDITENLDITTKQYVDQGLSSKADISELDKRVKLSTANATVGATAKPIYVKNGTAMVATDVMKEAFLQWGGKNFSANYGPLDAALISDLGADRFAFIPAAKWQVEYSRDNGGTWQDYGATDAQKLSLTSVGTSLSIGKATSENKATADYKLRLTLTTTNTVYSVLNKFAIDVSTKGSTGCYVTIEGRTKANVDAGANTWVTFAENIPVSGWPGWNIINTSGITTHGNTNNQYANLRFTFGCTGGSSTYSGLQIRRLKAFGGVGWQTPSNMAQYGSLYRYDYSQNALFPADVYIHNNIKVASINDVNKKQDIISDTNKLSASLVSGLATVATSGSYDDLTDKPTIPDPNNLAKLDAENTFTAKQTINSGMGVVSLKTQGYVEISASYAPKSTIGGLFGFKDDSTGRIYAINPRDLGFVERIKMNSSSIEPGDTGTVDLGTVLTAHQNIKTLKTNNDTAQEVSASEAISGSGTINLHKVAKTGSYNDLLNKPTIPTDTGATSVEVTGTGNAVTAASYNATNRKLTLTKGSTFLTSHQDISGKANLAGNNTFTGGQVITGGTSDGYSVKASGYVKGSWLQSSVQFNKGSGTGMVCVFDSAGWIYYRTPSEILSEASGVPKSAFSLSGTTLTITI